MSEHRSEMYSVGGAAGAINCCQHQVHHGRREVSPCCAAAVCVPTHVHARVRTSALAEGCLYFLDYHW